MASTRRYCMKLVRVKVPGTAKGRVDVCGEDAGHGGKHKGRWKGIVWESGPSANSAPTIISHGGSTVADLKD